MPTTDHKYISYTLACPQIRLAFTPFPIVFQTWIRNNINMMSHGEHHQKDSGTLNLENWSLKMMESGGWYHFIIIEVVQSLLIMTHVIRF